MTGAPRRDQALLAVGATGVALAAADTYVVVLALPDMMAGVGLGIEAFQRATPIVSGFLLGYVCVLPLVGRLVDVVDRLTVLRWCLGIFVIGSVATALAVDLPVLVGGRFLQGLGGGGLVPTTLALVADRWAPDRRGLPLGVVGAVQEVGAVVGPVLGAVVLAISDWRAIFWFGALVGVALFVATWAVTRSHVRGTAVPGRGRAGAVLGLLAAALALVALAAPQALVTDVTWGVPFVPFAGTSRVLTPIGVAAVALALLGATVSARRWWPVLRSVDILGAGLVAVALGALVLTFAAADPEREVVGPLGFALLPVAAGAAVLAVWRHRATATPLIPRGVLRGQTGCAVVVSALVGAALVAVVVDIPLLARLTWTQSQTDAALLLVRLLVAMPVGAVVGGWLLRHIGPGPVAAAGLTIAGLALLVTSTWGRGSLDDGGIVSAVLAACGLGLGTAFAPVNAASLSTVGPSAHGVASALVVVGRMIGMIVGLAALTSVGLHRYYDTVRGLPDQSDVGALLDAGLVQVQTVLAGGGLCALAGAALALAGLGRDRAARAETR